MTPRTLVWGVVALAFVALQLGVHSVEQPRAGGGSGRWSDAAHYGALADAFLAGEKPVAPAPFAYRIGVPWLAGRLSLLSGLSVDASFRLIDVVSLLALIATVYRFALRFCSPPFAALACGLYSLPFHGFSRRVAFEPVFVDIVWMLLAMTALSWMTRSRPSRRIHLALCLLSFFATCTRETGVLIPVVFLLPGPLRGLPVFGGRPRGDALWGVAMLASSFAAILLTRLVAQGTGDYSMAAAVRRAIALDSHAYVPVSACLAFGGPLLAVLFTERRRLKEIAERHPELVVYVALVIVLGSVGGESTVRFFGWASPVVLTAIAAGFEAMTREVRSERRRAVRYARSILLFLPAAYNVWMQHPFGGYHADWTAWIRWGGLTFSGPASVGPAAGALALAVAVVAAWRITERRPGAPVRTG